MSQPPSLRGAVDLAGLARSGPAAAGSAPTSPAPGQGAVGGAPAAGAGGGYVVEATDATFQQVVARTTMVPAVAVVWTSEHPVSKGLLDAVAELAVSLEGRIQVVSIDLATNPGLHQAIQPQQVPLALGLLAGQALPLLAGLATAEDLRPVVDELLAAAVQNGITGRAQASGPAGAEAADGVAEAEPALPPLHQAAYDAIERDDLDAAAAAYEQALAANPGDTDARLGLAQVGLMRRTRDVDLTAARAAAADDPTDIDAALVVADLDVLGGHVEDAFLRLVDLVRATTGPERARVREHLLELFDVVGNHDERVRKGRTALMSALY